MRESNLKRSTIFFGFRFDRNAGLRNADLESDPTFLYIKNLIRIPGVEVG